MGGFPATRHSMLLAAAGADEAARHREIMLPGSFFGAIVGWATTRRYGRGPAPQLAH